MDAHPLLRLTVASIAALLTACASGPNAHPRDPLEPMNRKVDALNQQLDEAVLKPVAQTYQDVTHPAVRQGVDNFLMNLQDIWFALNNALQLKPQATADSVLRVAVNTVFGMGGVFDIATDAGIQRSRQNFSGTLGHYGVPAGPYVVIPFLGPSTVRDVTDYPIWYRADPITYVNESSVVYSIYALRIVALRASLLKATELRDAAALDRYAFTRDVYLRLTDQRTRGFRDDDAGDDANDGALPPEEDADEKTSPTPSPPLPGLRPPPQWMK